MPEDTNEKTPILLLKKLLEGKQPPPDRGADGPLTTKGVQSREFAQREQKAKELKSTQENKGPKPEMDAKPKAEAIADKYKEELVRSGVPLSIEKKLQIIEHEVPAAKTDTLKQQFDDLKKEINSQPQSPDSRNRIETIIKGIPADVYTDKDLADIAREIKQTAYGHIMRNKAYMVGASIEDRVQMGETFKDAKSSRIYEDENYLRDIGENILHRPLTTADIQAEVQVSEDLVKHLNAGGDEADVDLVVKTMRPVEKLDEKTARQKIAEGPKWAQDAAGNITRDSHALSFLGEISDVYKINPDLVDDPTKLNPSLLFTKGIQLRVDSADFYASQGGSPDVLVQMQEGASVRDAVVEQVKLTIEGRPMFTSDRWDEHLYLMSEPKAFALGTGFSALWDPIADPTDALDPNDPREAELMKELRGFNNYTQGMTNPDLYDRELLSLFHKINFDFEDVLSKTGGRLVHYRERLLGRLTEIMQANNERFSTMFFEWEDQRRVFANMELSLQNLNDQYNKYARLYPNSFQESIKRSQGRMQEFIVQPDFRTKMIAYYENPENWGRINEYNEYQIDATHPFADHPIYKTITDDVKWEQYFKEIVDNFSMADVFQQIEVSFRASDFDKMADSLGAIGEHGPLVLMKGRGGFNNDVYKALDRKGVFRGAIDEDGDVNFLNGEGLKRVKDNARKEFLSPGMRAIHEEKLLKKFGPGYKYEEAVDRTIEDMSSLLMMELRRVRWGQRGLAIHLGAEQKGVLSTPFTSVAPEEAAAQALMPLEVNIEHWNSNDDVTQMMSERMTRMDSLRTGSGEYYKKMVEKTYNMPAKTPGEKAAKQEAIMELKRYTFSISQKDGPEGSLNHDRYKNVVERNLNFYFRRELDTGELMVLKPTRLEDVTKDQLVRALTFHRTLLNFTDREMLGSYVLREASWIRKAKIGIYNNRYFITEQLPGHDLTFKFARYREVGLHERACDEVAGAFDFRQGDHGAMHHAMEKLIKIDEAHPEKEGILITLDKCSPIYAVDALKDGGYMEANKMFKDHVTDFNIYPEDVTGKWNAFADQFLMREELINAAYAELPDPVPTAPNPADRGFRLNYAKVDLANAKLGFSDEEFTMMKGIFAKLHPEITDPAQLETVALQDMKNHLKAGNIMTKWLLEHEQLHALSEPVNAAYFLTIHEQDARNLTLDDDGNQFSLTIQKEDKLYGKGAGIVRNIKDLMNVQKTIVPYYLKAMRIGVKEEEFEQNRDTVFYSTEWTGGLDTNIKGMLYMTAAFNQITQKDLLAEAMGTKGEHPLVALSIHQRIVGTGGMARDTNKVEESMHRADARVGGKFEEYFPNVTHVVEKESRMIIGQVQWPKGLKNFGEFIYRRTGWKGLAEYFNKKIVLKSAWIPRLEALGLLGLLGLGAGVGSNLQKGFAQGSGGGGGGGGGSHDGH